MTTAAPHAEAAQAKIESPAKRRIRRVRAAINHALWLAYLYVYCRHFYRPHMRLVHRFGKHWHTRLYMEDGRTQDWCQWCGHRVVNDAAPPAGV